MTNIILCGGNGTRLWPISRELYPKQFLKLFDDKSLFQETIKRNKKVSDNTLVVTNIEHYALSHLQINEENITECDFLLEPIARNTAAAITIACLGLDNEDIVLVTPSDHLIKDEKQYKEVIEKAVEFAKEGFIVTFGIVPTYPETGYGYIKYDDNDVKEFLEKPNEVKAKEYVNSNQYLWNSGIFCFKVSSFLKEMKKYSLDVYKLSLKAYNNLASTSIKTIEYADMLNIPEISIDYALMEKTDKIKVVPSNIGWNDLGSFDSLYEELPKDSDLNTINDTYEQIDSKNNLILSNRHVSTIDIEDLLIVDSNDALLIAKKGSSQKVKKVVEKLKKSNSSILSEHEKNYRPWGNYKLLDSSLGYKIKKIEVAPGKRLSLQKHYHRSEHWIVVSGTAKVTINQKSFVLRPNESTYIKMGDVHRLENPGKIPLVVIEAQVGEYTEEDDIERIEDDFKRIM